MHTPGQMHRNIQMFLQTVISKHGIQILDSGNPILINCLAHDYLCFSTYWKSEDEVGMAGLGGAADTHPYVSFTLNFI